MMKILLAFAAAALAAALPIAASRAASYEEQASARRIRGPAEAAAVSSGLPVYDGEKLRSPPDYREWIYLTTGLDMSYNRVNQPGHHMFDSVFVNPVAWQAFQRTATWPDKTEIVLETRGAATKGSINKRGYYQDTELMGVEVHVKDVARFGGDGWAFFSFEDADKPAAMTARDNDCYSCHKAHGAVDSTFVQFYPTLLPLAKAKGTLAASYLQDVTPEPSAAH